MIPGKPTYFILEIDLIRLFGMKIDARGDTFKLLDKKDKKEIAFKIIFIIIIIIIITGKNYYIEVKQSLQLPKEIIRVICSWVWYKKLKN